MSSHFFTKSYQFPQICLLCLWYDLQYQDIDQKGMSMRKALRKLLEILDNTPAEYGQPQKGQSVLELAFITPLLIMLVAGTVEIGWFTNNYLIALETTRTGARFGTVLEGDNTALAWDDNDFFRATSPWDPAAQLNYSPTNEYRNVDPETRTLAQRSPIMEVRDCDFVGKNPELFGFYNLIACRMRDSLSPLVMNREGGPGFVGPPGPGLRPWLQPFGMDPNGLDDIVISAFSIYTYPRSVTTGQAPPGLTANQAYVVGRYPTNANECANQVGPERDPFAVNGNTSLDLYNGQPFELEGFDANPAENVRGFVMYGRRRVPGLANLCYGSSITLAQLETAFNLSLSQTLPADPSDRQFLPPGQGVVTAELFWQHTMLLNFPLFNPVFNMLRTNGCVAGGNASDPECNRTLIYVWAMFPLPSAEPKFQY
jgi:hypothetical protein